ncbi:MULTISPECIES: NACHT domain-containing NTPase [unclassified Streptomyces]|uniref:NACHT domain-containing protein n=1 Tax=unclassified Streptomyces TaxID=2593676 RepID=UPI00278BF3C5|nr:MULTISPECIES: NACHT domain-containing protein [unclassified Streptomyces]
MAELLRPTAEPGLERLAHYLVDLATSDDVPDLDRGPTDAAGGERCEARVTLLDDFPEAGAPARVRFDLAVPPTHPLRAESADGPRLLVIATPSDTDSVSPASRLYSVGGTDADDAVFAFTPGANGLRRLRFTVYDRAFAIPLQEVEAAVQVGQDRGRVVAALGQSLRRLGELDLTVQEAAGLTPSAFATRLRTGTADLSDAELAVFERALMLACRYVQRELSPDVTREPLLDDGGPARPAERRVISLLQTVLEVSARRSDPLDRPVPVRRLLSFSGGRGTMTPADLHRLTREMVRRAERVSPQPLPVEEHPAVAQALARSFTAMGEVTMSDAEAVAMGPTGFTEHLRSRSRDAARDLSADAAATYGALLTVSVTQFLRLLEQRPGFAARVHDEQHRHLAEHAARVDQLLSRFPERDDADAAFEERFGEDTATQYNQLTIHGIDLPHTPGSWSLHSAYLDLHCEPDPADALRAPNPAPVPVTQALSGKTRVLMRGDAGSGKTTLMQWLAVTTLMDELPDWLAHMRHRVPFLVSVRRLPPDGFPPPSDLLVAIGYPGADAQPAGWAERVLASGRGLLLVDGADEIPEAERERLRHRLREWIGLFPDNVWLVTTRPSAVPDDWLAAEGFSELRLAPMNRHEVTRFVRSWYRATRATAPVGEAGRLDHLEENFLLSIRLSGELQRLVASPLLCGVLCALHRDRGGVPRGRQELYEAALWMLLERRDRARHIAGTAHVEIPLGPKRQLLQILAYWMLRNDRPQMDGAEAFEAIQRSLDMFPEADAWGGAEGVYRYLLERTGLLHEPAPDKVEFSHDVFRDYLAASELVRRHEFDLLLNNAHRPEWADVVRMAVAQARPDEQAELLRGLIAPHSGAHRVDAYRRKLLAVASLDEADNIDPAIHARVLRFTKALTHPTTPAAARALGWAGAVALDVLPDPTVVPDDEAHLLAITATYVGDDRAIDYLTLLRDRDHLEIRSQLAGAWRNFDTDRYAEEIIAHLDETDLWFPVSDLKELQTLAALGGRPRVRVTGPLTPDQLTAHLPPDRLTHLWFSHAFDPHMEWLRAFPRLRTVHADTRLHRASGVPDGVELVQP